MGRAEQRIPFSPFLLPASLSFSSQPHHHVRSDFLRSGKATFPAKEIPQLMYMHSRA